MPFSKFLSRSNELSKEPLIRGRKAENIPPQSQEYREMVSLIPVDPGIHNMVLDRTSDMYAVLKSYNMKTYGWEVSQPYMCCLPHGNSCLNCLIPWKKLLHFHSVVCFPSIPVHLRWYFCTLCETAKLISLWHSD